MAPSPMPWCCATPPGARTIDEYPDFPIPPLAECMRRYEEAARLTNPAARCTAVSLNTRGLNGRMNGSGAGGSPLRDRSTRF